MNTIDYAFDFEIFLFMHEKNCIRNMKHKITSPKHPLPNDSLILSWLLGISHKVEPQPLFCCLQMAWTVVVIFHGVSAIGKEVCSLEMAKIYSSDKCSAKQLKDQISFIYTQECLTSKHK